MSTLHYLNVNAGDCTIIQHNSGRCTMFDICAGNLTALQKLAAMLEGSQATLAPRLRGDYGMRNRPTNPIDYLRTIGVSSVFRFIASHPDMDHLDGFNALMDQMSVANFWDNGARREKPDFAPQCPYEESDWNRYVKVRDGDDSPTVLLKRAGAQFQFANQGEDGTGGGDGIHILAPTPEMVREANTSGQMHDASYVLLYRSVAGKILMPGDAHDATWEYLLEHCREDIADCNILLAPHHGRKSDRDYSFLDVVRPRLTFFGCAPSDHLAYDAWRYRNLPVITNNQAGNIVCELTRQETSVYVENERYAADCGADVTVKNSQGYVCVGTIGAPVNA